jgi:hypothetical protein
MRVGMRRKGVQKNAKNNKVLPGIEPGLPEDTELIRIRSDNRYLIGELAGAREKCCSEELTLQNHVIYEGMSN